MCVRSSEGGWARMPAPSDLARSVIALARRPLFRATQTRDRLQREATSGAILGHTAGQRSAIPATSIQGRRAETAARVDARRMVPNRDDGVACAKGSPAGRRRFVSPNGRPARYSAAALERDDATTRQDHPGSSVSLAALIIEARALDPPRSGCTFRISRRCASRTSSILAPGSRPRMR